MVSGLGERECTPGLAGSFSAELDFPGKKGPGRRTPSDPAEISPSELPSKGAARPACPWDPRTG